MSCGINGVRALVFSLVASFFAAFSHLLPSDCCRTRSCRDRRTWCSLPVGGISAELLTSARPSSWSWQCSDQELLLKGQE